MAFTSVSEVRSAGNPRAACKVEEADCRAENNPTLGTKGALALTASASRTTVPVLWAA